MLLSVFAATNAIWDSVINKDPPDFTLLLHYTSRLASSTLMD